MFTGLILAVGAITHITPRHEDLHLTISAGQLNLKNWLVGDSIAVNGVCLTLTAHHEQKFEVLVSQETLRVSTGLNVLGEVNLEPALKIGDALGGHWVSGHVDGQGYVTELEAQGGCQRLSVRLPRHLLPYMAVKGSVCLHGVSLTINAVTSDSVSVNLIPHTLHNTTLGHLQVGDRLNVEVDLIARYVVRWQEYIANQVHSSVQPDQALP